MSDIRKVMNEEIRRLARKEIKAATAPILAANAALKKRVAEQEKRIRALEAARPVSAAAAGQKADADAVKAEGGKEKQIRLTPERIRKIRTKLAVSQAQFAKILGVNTQSVNFWENGKTSPRSALKKQLAVIRDMGKREIAKLMEEKEIVAKKAAKAAKAVKSTIKAVRKAIEGEAAAAKKKPGRKPKKALAHVAEKAAAGSTAAAGTASVKK